MTLKAAHSQAPKEQGGVLRRLGQAILSLRWLPGAERLTPVAPVEIATRAEDEERHAHLAEARRDAEAWKARSQLYQARIAELEAEAVASEVMMTDLRARLVCVHGKLAAAAATARYRSFATALGSRARDA